MHILKKQQFHGFWRYYAYFHRNVNHNIIMVCQSKQHTTQVLVRVGVPACLSVCMFDNLKNNETFKQGHN